MTVVATALLVGLAGFLLVAAAAKAASPRAATAALAGLGLKQRPARVAVGVATTVEVAAAVAIVLQPSDPAAQVLCLALFGLFALAGILAVSSGRAIECGCMGALHRSTLGWSQVAQFAVVAFAIGLVREYPPAWNSTSAATVLFALVVATGTVLAAFAAPAWSRTRRARASLASVAPYMHYADPPEPTLAVETSA